MTTAPQITADISRVANWEHVCYLYSHEEHPHPLGPGLCDWTPCGDGVKRCLHPLTQALAHASYLIGLSEITEGNWREWCYRCERIISAGLKILIIRRNGEDEDFFPDPGILMAHIGLRTTAQTLDTAAFEAHARKLHLRLMDRRIAAFTTDPLNDEDSGDAPGREDIAAKE